MYINTNSTGPRESDEINTEIYIKNERERERERATLVNCAQLSMERLDITSSIHTS